MSSKSPWRSDCSDFTSNLIPAGLFSILTFLLLVPPSLAYSQVNSNETWNRYFEARVSQIETQAAAFDPTHPESREQLFEMLGLKPLPAREDLRVVVTGEIEREGVTVEKLHFQSSPGLYVTANLYRPTNADKRCPAVLYLCGHGGVKKGDISFGNKVHYQHHGYWLAQHGFVCLTIDSLQLGEIEAIHHGTYQYDRWWWLNRGYTPAGVEAWNCIRAIDYLVSRPDVDPAQIACTGRSGGGAYSWWIAALDERIACAIPVAGITDLRDHVVGGCVEGHCDCMFMVNTYRWDYPQVAALVAPRPLLIINTDRDPIFPLEGVMRTHQYVLKYYNAREARNQLGLVIGPGPHEDTQNLQVPALRWLQHHFAGHDRPISDVALPRFSPEELRVFDSLPSDEINTKIDQLFCPVASFVDDLEQPEAEAQIADWRSEISQQVLRPWYGQETGAPQLTKKDTELAWSVWELATETDVTCQLLIPPIPDAVSGIHIVLLTSMEEFAQTIEQAPPEFWVVGVLPRGTGLTAWAGDERSRTQFHRRLYLLGETLAAGQVWDVRQAIAATQAKIQAQRSIAEAELTVSLEARGAFAWVAILTAVQEPKVSRMILRELSTSATDRPPLLNIDRVISPENLLGLAGERCQLVIHGLPEGELEGLRRWAAQRSWPTDRVLIQR